MKRTTKFALAGLALGICLTAGVVAIDQVDIPDKIEQASMKAGLPKGCMDLPLGDDEKVLHCEAVDLALIVANKKASEAEHLGLYGGTLGESSLAGMPNLKSLSIDAPQDPASIIRLVNTGEHLEEIFIPVIDPGELEVSVPTVHIGSLSDAPGEDYQDRYPAEKVNAGFSPTVLSSMRFYVLSPAAAAKVTDLEILQVVEGKSIDLSGYTSLKNLAIEIEKGADVVLPRHISKNGDLTVTRDGSTTTFELYQG